MLQCQFCQSEVKDNHNFCKSCSKQIKCLECKAFLETDAEMCLECGAPIRVSVAKQVTMNTLLWEEKRTNNSSYKRVKTEMSDNAVNQIGNVLHFFSSNNDGVRSRKPLAQRSVTILNEELPLLNQGLILSEDDEEVIESNNVEPKIAIMPVTDEKAKASNYFRVVSDTSIITKHKDFKGKGKKISKKDSLYYMYGAITHFLVVCLKNSKF
jgi:hypothetical protein